MTGSAAEDVVAGLGETGETYLAGQDDLMRSNSREIIDSPKEYAQEAVARGTSRDIVDRALEAKSTVMLQPIKSKAPGVAKDGKSGTIITTDYLGHEVLDIQTGRQTHRGSRLDRHSQDEQQRGSPLRSMTSPGPSCSRRQRSPFS